MQTRSNQVFLFLTHSLTEAIKISFEEISKASYGFGQPVLLFHKKEKELPIGITKYDFFAFTDESLFNLDYIPLRNTIIPGSNHFSLMKFYRENANYDYYWVIEHDVRYNGDWRQFFRAFAEIEADFISSHVRWAYEEPFWNWWFTLKHPTIFIPFQLRLRSFNPIFRISGRSLKFINNALLKKWRGHHEVLFPTLLNLSGYKILDFGGEGKFVLPGSENKYYTSHLSNEGELSSGTFRYRPIMDNVGPNENKLYHPVKDSPGRGEY